MHTIYIVLIISFLGPIVGSAIGVLGKPSEKIMYGMLSFAAGVMIAVSFLELIPRAIELSSVILTTMGIAIGSLVMYLLDRLIPHIHPELCKSGQGFKLEKTATYLLIGIFLHNIPEGIAIATGTISGLKETLAIAIAISIQNIPEGICTSSPYYYATKKRLRAFLISSSTAIPIIVGFFLGKYVFSMVSLSVVGVIIAATAGLMIYISGDELIPASCNKNNGSAWSHSTIFSLMAGVMLVVLMGLF